MLITIELDIPGSNPNSAPYQLCHPALFNFVFQSSTLQTEKLIIPTMKGCLKKSSLLINVEN